MITLEKVDGATLEAEAEKAGIHSIIQRNAWPTSTVEVSLKNGIPEYTIVKGVAWDHLLLTRQLIEVVEQADAICYGTLALRSPETHDTIIELLKHTKPGAMKFFDINLRGDHYSKELIEELLKVATVFKINDEELLLLRDMFDIRGTSGEDASRWFLEEFDLDYVILTAGSAYSTIISRKGEVSTLDTPRVEVNDTVGAGDSFSGTFTARILLGDTLAEAHRKAVNTAAFVCTQAGAWPEYPAEMPDSIPAKPSCSEESPCPFATPSPASSMSAFRPRTSKAPSPTTSVSASNASASIPTVRTAAPSCA